ncbi:HTH_Tnp_Tc3_2 domain-containing protein [Trichonephila clavipes]|nr:HTH_Tnp_Tc3_2 domain-containing protein [Trichonephila clavipes]
MDEQWQISAIGSGRPRAITDQEVRSAVTAHDSSLLSIRRATRTQVSTTTVHRGLRERNLRSYRLLRPLTLTHAHCRATLQWCLARSGWNHDDWGRVVFRDESRFQLCPNDHRRRVWRLLGQRADPSLTITRHTRPQPRTIVF